MVAEFPKWGEVRESSLFGSTYLISMKFTTTCLLFVLSTVPSLWAGDPPAIPPVEPAEATGWENKILLGYDSHYVFRGEMLQKNVGWAQWSLDVPLSDSLNLNLNPWYYHDLDTDFNEFDLNVTLSASLGTYEVAAAYNGYYYPRGGLGNGEGLGDEQEFALSVAHDIFSLKATALAAYNVGRDGYYFELLVAQPYEINDTLSVELGVAVGFDADYFSSGLGFNHVQAMLSFPIKLTVSIELTPYVAGNFPGGHLDYEDTRVFGGVQLGFSF